MGKKIGAASFLEILAPELNDRILADMLDLETGVIVNLHIKSIDQSEAIKTIKRKITDLDKMKIEEQKKAVRSGYDMDIILMLSRLVDTFFSRTSWTMLLYAENHSISVA